MTVDRITADGMSINGMPAYFLPPKLWKGLTSFKSCQNLIHMAHYECQLKPGTKGALCTPQPHFSSIEMGNDHHQIFLYPVTEIQ